MLVFNVYAFPSLPVNEYEALLARVVGKVEGKRPSIIAGDFNAWPTEVAETPLRETNFLEVFETLEVLVVNTRSTSTFWTNGVSSIADVTFSSDSLMKRIEAWRVNDLCTNSNHQATFRIAELNRGINRESISPDIDEMPNHSIQTPS